MGSKDRNFHEELMARMDHPEAAQEIPDHFLAGERGGAVAAVPNEFIDEIALLGPRELVQVVESDLFENSQHWSSHLIYDAYPPVVAQVSPRFRHWHERRENRYFSERIVFDRQLLLVFFPAWA
jgi:hypothetical protein